MLTTLKIGTIEISSFWLLLILGIIGMYWCTYRRRALFSLSYWQCGVFTALLTIVGVAGALGLCFLESGSFGGVSFYGSVFLIPLLMPPIGLLFRLKPTHTMDICGPCVAIMIGCMRVNCFLAGCCGGWEMCIDNFCFEWPTQIIDSISDFIILSWLLQLEGKRNANGILYPLFMVTYSIMRFFLEFLRDTPKEWLHLSHGQWFALVAVLVGFLWLLIRKRKLSVI